MYKKLLLFCILTTGMVSLVYQMVWQRYLAILVGSEAKSATLVVAIFLLGLSLGYALFGYLTNEKEELISTRRGLLKFYGWVEFATSAYVVCFPTYFVLLQKLSFNGPLSFIFDTFIVVIAILLPTILMGATIPLMTMVFPEAKNKHKTKEIDSYHATIYGVNTVGAFIGCLLGGYLLIPWLGLPYSLFVMGGLNFIVSIIYIVNPLQGKLIVKSHREREVKQAKQEISSSKDQNYMNNLLCYGLVFVIGAVTIGLEILLVRILALTIGFNVYVFPTVLGLVVLGIGLGSLFIVRHVNNTTHLKNKHYNHFMAILNRLLLGCIGFAVFFVLVPYLPSIINHLRVSLVTVPLTQFVFLGLTFVILGIVLIPSFYFLGSLLPLVYCTINKNQKNYGRVCGYLYFFNTIGSLVGAIFLGYGFLYFASIDIEDVFRLCILTLLIMGVVLSCTKEVMQDFWSFKHYKLKVFVSIFVLFYLGFMFLTPEWNRRHHYVGLFRNQEMQSYHFKSFFLPKSYAGNPIFIEDGPNSTIAVLKGRDRNFPTTFESYVVPGPNYEIMSIIVNGKSDGSSWGDFPTVYATALLPYLHASTSRSLKTAVIGFGTGITAGSIGRFEDVESVEAIEISNVLVRRHPIFDPVNFHVSQNPKIQVIESDAFKFLTHSKTTYDFIASEASNPWVVGVENLFALEFYELLSRKLSSDGVLAQWFHTYSMNLDLVKMIFNNLSAVFPHVKTYVVGSDLVIIAKKSEFDNLGNPSDVLQRRFSEPFVSKVNQVVGIGHLLSVKALELTNEMTSLHLGSTNSLGYHTLEHPKLTFGADRSFFLDESVSVYDIINHSLITRHFYNASTKEDALKFITERETDGTNCHQATIREPFCPWYTNLINYYNQYQQGTSSPREAIISYSNLRRLGFISTDQAFLEQLALHLVDNFDNSVHSILIKELYVEGLHEEASTYLNALQGKNIFTQTQVNDVKASFDNMKTFIMDQVPLILNQLKSVH